MANEELAEGNRSAVGQIPDGEVPDGEAERLTGRAIGRRKRCRHLPRSDRGATGGGSGVGAPLHASLRVIGADQNECGHSSEKGRRRDQTKPPRRLSVCTSPHGHSFREHDRPRTRASHEAGTAWLRHPSRYGVKPNRKVRTGPPQSDERGDPSTRWARTRAGRASSGRGPDARGPGPELVRRRGPTCRTWSLRCSRRGVRTGRRSARRGSGGRRPARP